MKKSLWSRNYTLLTIGTILGATGGILSSFALSFLVYDETGSTFAAASLIAVQIIPNFLIPLLLAPTMDRLPRKPFLVGGDAINGILYMLAGLYLLKMEFSYGIYMLFSLLISSIYSFDILAYESIFPKLIPEGCEQKGYAVSAMIYPVLQVIMAPVAAALFEGLGVAKILIIQAGLSLMASAIESRIRVEESRRNDGTKFSFRRWWGDIRDAIAYLKKEKGVQSIFAYVAFSSGVGTGQQPLLVAFFRTVPGLTVAMYSFFSVAEFAGRAIGGLMHYHFKIPEKKRFGFAFFVYEFYSLMDAVLLWLPYPIMLVNRGVCGFLGVNSATMRQAAVQSYLPDGFRARMNAFSMVLNSAVMGVMSLAVGALGEVMDLRWALTLCGAVQMLFCWGVVWLRRADVANVYNRPAGVQNT